MDASTSMNSIKHTSETVSRTVGHMRDQIDDSDQRLRAFVREYPLTSFLAAVAAGYLVARLAWRL